MTTFANGESGLSVRTKINNVLQHTDGTAGELVINEAGADVDFRVESDTNANALFVDGATGNVGVGTSSVSSVFGTTVKVFSSGSGGTLDVGGSTVNARLFGSEGLSIAGFGTSTNHPFTLFTNDTERLRVNSSGNVGIGTSSPATLLHLGGASNKAVRLDTALGNAAFLAGWENTLQIGVNRNPANGVITDGGKAAAAVRLVGEAGNSYFTVETTSTNNAAPTERLRIDANGNLLVGATGGLLNERIRAEFGAGNTGITTSVASTAAQSHIAFYNGSVVGSIGTTGSATSYNTSSDYRLKEDLRPIADASSRLASLNPVNFAWKADGTRTDGFIAHEVQAVVPQAVTGEKDGEAMQAIDHSKLVPLLTAALQEALAKIALLEARITALEA